MGRTHALMAVLMLKVRALSACTLRAAACLA